MQYSVKIENIIIKTSNLFTCLVLSLCRGLKEGITTLDCFFKMIIEVAFFIYSYTIGGSSA